MLQIVAEHPSQLGLTEVAESLGLAKATAHGLLRTLVDIGYVAQEVHTGKYLLGDALQEIGRTAIDPHDLRSHAVNWCDSLASRSGESVRLTTLVHGAAVVVNHVFRPDDSQQTLEVGDVLPLHASAAGKVLLAWGPSVRARSLTEFDAFTPATVTSARTLARTLVDFRAQGWAADVEEFRAGEASVAAPVRGAIGRVVGALDIHGPLDRLCDSRGRPRPHLVAQVVEAARSISRDVVTDRR